jgi:nucleotide-binding universal stress UspA family protein
MIKHVVVNLWPGNEPDAALDYAVSLAAMFEAHLAGVAFAYEAVPATMLIDDVPPVWIDQFLKDAEDAARAAVDKFNAAAAGAKISAEARWWNVGFTGTGEVLGRIARRFDLAVVRQAEPDKGTPAPLIIEAALFETGRPVLIVPYIQKAPMALDRVLVGWDGSHSAARAVNDALPFLKRAKAVDVVVVSESGKSDEMPGADLAHHLARHDVKVEIKQIVAPDADAANVLLSHAADSSATFMVMGAYGHSRLREFILGGVTRTILDSMTIPTLMSH